MTTEMQTTVATKQPSGFDVIREQLASKMTQIAVALPNHLRNQRVIDRWQRVILSAIAKDAKIQSCSPASILQSIQQAAQLGLEPTGVLGGAYLVPFKGVCTLIVGYRGLIDLARRSGQIESIEAHLVYEADKFKCIFGADIIEHEPCWTGNRGEVKLAYAIARLKGGSRQIEVMSRQDLDRIKAFAMSRRSGGPWIDHEGEMQRKTVVRRLAKYLPLSVEVSEALGFDEDEEMTTTSEETPKQVGGVAKLKSLVANLPAPEEEEAEAADNGNDEDIPVSSLLAEAKTLDELEQAFRRMRELPPGPMRDELEKIGVEQRKHLLLSEKK